MPAQRLAAEFESHVTRLSEGRGSLIARLERDVAIVLRRIADAVAAAPQAFGEDEPPVFLNLAKRIIGEMGERAGDRAGSADADAAPRLIVPG